MRRTVTLCVTFCLLGAASHGVIAQDEPSYPLGSNPIGEPLTIYTAEGIEAAQVTVTEVTDPFEDYDQSREPQQGERYVLVVLEIENTGQDPYAFQRWDFCLLDTVARLHRQQFIPRTDQSTFATPDLIDENLLPGETVSGALVYRVPHDAELTQVIYPVYSVVQQLYLLADLTSAAQDEAA